MSITSGFQEKNICRFFQELLPLQMEMLVILKLEFIGPEFMESNIINIFFEKEKNFITHNRYQVLDSKIYQS